MSSVPEDYEHFLTASPESYNGIVGKAAEYHETPLGRRESALEAMVESAGQLPIPQPQPQRWSGSVARTGSKRGRSDSVEASLHDNVRGLLGGAEGVAPWREALVRPGPGVPAPPVLTRRSSKRLCCSAEVSQVRGDYLGLTPPMWAGIP